MAAILISSSRTNFQYHRKEMVSMLFLEAYITFSTFSFPLGNTSPLHNLIKMYKLSKIYTRGRKVKAAITGKKKKKKQPKHCHFPSKLHKKVAKFLGTRSMGNQNHLLASGSGVPVCAVRAMPETLGKVFSQSLEAESQHPLLTSLPLLCKPVKLKVALEHHSAL